MIKEYENKSSSGSNATGSQDGGNATPALSSLTSSSSTAAFTCQLLKRKRSDYGQC